MFPLLCNSLHDYHSCSVIRILGIHMTDWFSKFMARNTCGLTLTIIINQEMNTEVEHLNYKQRLFLDRSFIS